ncbi:MAG: methionine-rich copper-binding protein CopC [Paraglaciecola sp.]|jgi:methionine-rich copper-binding protein CopC
MKKYIAIIFTAIMSTYVFAHTGLTSSIPANNAMLMKSPEKVEVVFKDEVRLVSLSVLNGKDESVEIDFAPSMKASETFSYDLPMLMPSTYTLSWTIMGDDGHKMKGDFSFMVHAMNKMKDMKDKKMEHSEHKNH